MKFKDKDAGLYKPLVALSNDRSLTERRFSSFCDSKMVRSKAGVGQLVATIMRIDILNDIAP